MNEWGKTSSSHHSSRASQPKKPYDSSPKINCTEQFNQLCCSYIIRISNFLTLHITSTQPNSCFTVCHFQNPTMVPISISVKVSCKRNQKYIFQTKSSKEIERKYGKSIHFFQSLKNQSQSPQTKAILNVGYQELNFTFIMEIQD